MAEGLVQYIERDLLVLNDTVSQKQDLVIQVHGTIVESALVVVRVPVSPLTLAKLSTCFVTLLSDPLLYALLAGDRRIGSGQRIKCRT